jgi:hypothetical protein
MLKAASLWEKTSAAGNRYFIGRLGGVRILILDDRSRGVEGEPDWQLFFCDGEKRENSRAETPTGRCTPPRGSASPKAQSAVQQIQVALVKMRGGGNAFAGYYEAQLPNARSLLDRLTGRQ